MSDRNGLGKRPYRAIAEGRDGFLPSARQLNEGEDRFRPTLHRGTGRSGDTSLAVGDNVLCRVRGSEYLHLVKAIQGGRFQIGNNRGRINGWIGANGIFGRCTSVGD